MKTKSTLAALLAVGLTGLPLSVAVADTNPVGLIQKVQAQATATQAGKARDLDMSAPVMFGDRLRTGPGARLEAKLDDGTVLTLGEKGKLDIDSFTYDPNKSGGKLGIKVSQGAFLFVGGKIEGPRGGNVSIETPVGTLGVRGTTVWGGHIDGGFGVLVLSGEVSVTNAKGTVMLEKGQGTMVYDNKGPAEAAPWTDDRTKRAVATISFK